MDSSSRRHGLYIAIWGPFAPWMAGSMLGLVLLAGTANAQLEPSSLRVWATDSFVDGVEGGLKPVIAQIVCSIPVARLLDGESIQEGAIEITVKDLKLSRCSVRGFAVHNVQGDILVEISGLNAAVWGTIDAQQANCAFLCTGPMNSMFTADMHDSNIGMLLKLDALNEKPVVRAETVSADILLRNMQLQNPGLTAFANLFASDINRATNRQAKRMVSNIVHNASAVFDRLPFHGVPIGHLLGGAIPRAANLQLDADVQSIRYVTPAWVFDVLTALYSPPEVGRRSYPYVPTPLSRVPPIEHRSQQVICTASPWGINQALFTVEQLGFFSTPLDVNSRGTRVPASLSTSPSLAVRGDRAEITLKSTFLGRSERTNSTITLGSNSPRLLLTGNLLKAKVAGTADARADIKGCGARTASIRHSPQPGSASSYSYGNLPEIVVQLRSERQDAPWWVVECDSPGGNLLMSALGLDNVEATVKCIRQGLTGGASSSATLQCLITVWSTQMDLLFGLAMRAGPALPEVVLSFSWDQLVALAEDVIVRSPGGETRSADLRALHACLEERTPATKVSETCRCMATSVGPAIDATYPTIIDMRSIVLTPALATVADGVVAGAASSTAPAVLARINVILGQSARPIQEVLNALMRIFHDLLISMSESAGSERNQAIVASLRRLVPALWSAVQRVGITVDGTPIGEEYDLSDLDALIDRTLSALIAGKSFKWSVAAKDANLVGTYTRSGVDYVFRPPAVLYADIELDPIFAAAGSVMPRLAPSSAGSLRVGYRADTGGFEYMAEADWRAITLKLLDFLRMASAASALRALPAWVNKFLGEWGSDNFWVSLDLGIDGRKILALMPMAMDELFNARYTSELRRILQF